VPTTRRQALEDFSTGVVFAIDTTRSMGPYFDPVMNAVAEIYGRLQGSGAAGQLSFGLVGFRDAVVRQDIEYLSRTFVPLTSASNPEVFVQGLTEMREATGSTKGFNEDSFAGVKHALDSMEWSGVDARFVVLVTDAGPRVGNDPLSATGLGARGLANYAKDIRGAHVLTLHLTTPRGNHTHGFAAQAYTELSRVGSADPLYYEVPDGTPGNLERSARLVADALAGAILAARQGEEIDVDGYTPPVDATEAEAELGRRTLKVARSMQLDYLGSETSAEAPDVFEGWIADRDFRNNGVKPIEVRLLVNRSQMSDLYEAMRLVVEKGEESGLEPTTFFQKVLTAAAEMSRRPDNVAAIAEDASIADAALIGELLEGLPYRSQIMGIDESAWLSMNIAEQTELLDLLADKVARYEDAIAGVDNWVLLNPDQTSDEAVYPMPLENLP
ncbi:MAG: vWA domain-containing protein, partial [Pseudomonadota bacterium]